MTPTVYSEIWSVLNTLGIEYINKLPNKLVRFIDAEKDDAYMPIYSEEWTQNQDISEDALNFITFLNLKYWCDEIEKEEIIDILKKNENILNEIDNIKAINFINNIDTKENKLSMETEITIPHIAQQNMQQEMITISKKGNNILSKIFNNTMKLLKSLIKR